MSYLYVTDQILTKNGFWNFAQIICFRRTPNEYFFCSALRNRIGT